MDLIAKWIGIITDEKIGKGDKHMIDGAPASYFRREFSVDKSLKKATLIMSACGIYQGYINGEKIDEALFKPQWSDYRQEIDYDEFDITSRLVNGKNCIGAVVGDGWYSGRISIIGRQYYGTYPLKLFLQLNLEYNDGSIEYINSDESFKAGTGKIRENDFLNGETFDNRIASDNFSKIDFDDSSWKDAKVLESETSKLKKSFVEPILYHEEFIAKLKKEVGDIKIYDIGQNLAGNIKVRLKACYGDEIVFRYGEMLDENGDLYTENLRSAKATDIYIASGDNSETYTPLFTFHGFRYIEIKSPKTVKIEKLSALAIYSSLKQTGDFETDNKLINKIYNNAKWGQKSNFVGLPTDCPQRDERMGWTGDSFAFCGSAMFNMDCRKFYKKYMRDLMQAMRDDGAVPDVVPYVSIVGFGNNGWGDVVTELPYLYYKMYGDKEFLNECLPSMKKWVQFLLNKSNDYILQFDGFGDWLSIKLNETDVIAMNTAFFAHSSLIVSKVCKLLGDEESDKYLDLFNKIKDCYAKKFICGNKVATDNQGDYLLASNFGLIDKDIISENLVNSIKREDNHLSCGFMSIKFLLPTLCETGNTALAYELMGKDTYPSWGYSVRQGATTIWERWNSFTLSGGFGNVEMNSFNHYSFGSCTEWMFRYVLGIDSDFEIGGFKTVLIKPYIDFSGVVKTAKGSYDSQNGKIKVSWTVKNNICHYNLDFDVKMEIKEDFSQYEVIRIEKSTTSLKAVLKL